MAEAKLAEAAALLGHAQSAKRRSGAKTLRKLADVAAGPALLDALRKELADPRTWETQYQMIMALGACRYAAAEPFLRELAGRPFDATMVLVAIGDALVRLTQPPERMPQTVLELVRGGKLALADGACQALGMLRLVPAREAAEELMAFARRFPLEETQTLNRRLWIAAAAPGWLELSPMTRPFLTECLESKDRQLQLAAEAALQGKYRAWSPL